MSIVDVDYHRIWKIFLNIHRQAAVKRQHFIASLSLDPCKPFDETDSAINIQTIYDRLQNTTDEDANSKRIKAKRSTMDDSDREIVSNGKPSKSRHRELNEETLFKILQIMFAMHQSGAILLDYE